MLPHLEAEAEKQMKSGENQYTKSPSVKSRQGKSVAGATETQHRGRSAVLAGAAKLSRLQRQILQIALRWRGQDHADVFAKDVMVEAFGLPPLRHYVPDIDPDEIPRTARNPAGKRVFGHSFDVDGVGRARYNSICASISRTFKRLEARGLLQKVGWGYSLTEQGLETVKKANNCG